jgi:hypothetical protein
LESRNLTGSDIDLLLDRCQPDTHQTRRQKAAGERPSVAEDMDRKGIRPFSPVSTIESKNNSYTLVAVEVTETSTPPKPMAHRRIASATGQICDDLCSAGRLTSD